jgi:aspartate ammonia-lyase
MFRIEKDSLGKVKVPSDKYYGSQTVRAIDNFNITNTPVHNALIMAVTEVKIATTIANFKSGKLTSDQKDAMLRACEEILQGRYNDNFPVDAIQGGAGTSINMNMNEVISNRAEELLGGNLGEYKMVHPNDHCNYGQSTNDVIPTAGKIAIINQTNIMIKNLKKLIKSIKVKEKEFADVIKMGRTHLQDAVPITLGQTFKAIHVALTRNLKKIESSIDEIKFINMGGTAVGTGINANSKYSKMICKELSGVTGIDLVLAKDLIDSTRHLDAFLDVSAALRTLAVTLSKNANDIRLMASGPKAGLNEINLPMKQPGSSIMPGKVNPVIAEVVNQVAFQVIGNDTTIMMAAEAGQFELNVFEPVMFKNLLESVDTLSGAIKTFDVNLIQGLSANEKVLKDYVYNSAGIVTALAPILGYEKCSLLAKESIKKNIPIKKLVLSKKLMKKEELEKALSTKILTGK